MIRRRLLLLAAMAIAGQAQAQNADQWPDFIVRPPPPFQVSPGHHPQNDKVLSIRSWSGVPRSANRDGTLCSVAFKGAPQNASLQQAEINASVQADEWRATARQTLTNVFTVNAETIYEADGIVGVEFVLTPKVGPDAANVRLVMAIAETPKGRATLSCAVPASDLETSLPYLRSIRATIQIPK